MAKRKEETILNAVEASGAGSAINVEGYDNILLQFATSGSTTATVKLQASLSAAEPTWGSAASPTNMWDYIQAYDLEDTSTPVTGDNGIALTGTDDCLTLLVNTSGITWLNANVTAYTQGAITLKAVIYIGNE